MSLLSTADSTDNTSDTHTIAISTLSPQVTTTLEEKVPPFHDKIPKLPYDYFQENGRIPDVTDEDFSGNGGT